MDHTALRLLLSELQIHLEEVRRPVEVQRDALEALVALAECVDRRSAESPLAFVQVATLLEFSHEVPALKRLLQHYPVLVERNTDRPAAG